MGWSFRKSKKLIPGVRATLSHRGIGFRLGSRHAGVSVTPTGARVSGSIPGTGISARKELGTKKRRSSSAGQALAEPEYIACESTLKGYWLSSDIRLPNKITTPLGSQISIVKACVDIDYIRDGYAIQITNVQMANTDPNAGGANTGEQFRLGSIGNSTMLIEIANRELHDENMPLRRCILGHSYNLPDTTPSRVMSAILLPIYLVGFLVFAGLGLALLLDDGVLMKVVGGVFAIIALVVAAKAFWRLRVFV